TIDGIKIVVDSGLQNVSVFNPFSGMNRLESIFISQDSATQRAGRAGRLSAGKAYHLWHKSKILLKHDVPEILSADLTQLLLELALWGNDEINTLSWLDTPPPTAISHAKKLLVQLGALDKKGLITPHGKAMSRFGLHPRLAHMMIKAKELNLSYEASLLCAIVTEKDFYTSRSADIKERVTLLHDLKIGHKTDDHQINIKQGRYLLKIAKKLASTDQKNINTQMLGVLLAFAYPDRIAKQRVERKGTFLLLNKKGATLHRDDDLCNARFLVVSDLDGRATNATIYKAIELTQAQIEAYLHEQIEERDEINWNDEQNRVEVRRVQSLGAIILKAMQINNASSQEVTEVLVEALEELGLDVLNWSKEALSLRERLNFMFVYEAEFFCR
ncbi:MAG: ATP-dependent helicase HrpB, partial [Sulfurovaceae bacterium]|nr:ATP-dependent helicase HrpB [Sulfurovaceae bacterium]